MSIYSQKVDPEFCGATRNDLTGSVFIRHEKGYTTGSFNAIEIDTPGKAHALRMAVNKGVDLYLKNYFKKF